MNDLPADADEFIEHLREIDKWQKFNGYRQRLGNNFHGATYTPDEKWRMAAVMSGYNEWTALEPLPDISAEVKEELLESHEARKRRTRNLARQDKNKKSRASVENVVFDAIPRAEGSAEYSACTEWVFQHMGETREQLESLGESPGPALEMLKRVLSSDSNWNKFMDRYDKLEALKKQKELGQQAMKDDGRKQMALLTDFWDKEGL